MSAVTDISTPAQECRACYLKSASIAAFAQSAYQLREENWALGRQITELQTERDEAQIDREVFRAWCQEWMPATVTVLIGLQREINNLHARVRHLAHERDDARRQLQATGAKLRAVVERVA
jgi:hypothetical protein